MQLNYPKLERLSLNKVFEGEATHFNPACAEMIDRIVGPVVGEEVIDVTREVNCEGSRLDLLAVTNDHTVAIELQFNGADASHLGRLIGWYAPLVDATVSILVAESFPESLVHQIQENKIQSLALVRATAGWNKDGQVGLNFDVVASSIQTEIGNNSGSSEANERNIESIQLLSTALAKYGLRDSNAKYYIRLFPVKDHVWATAEVRVGRVVVTVGSSTNARSEEIVGSLKDGWVGSNNGKRLYLTISDSVENYLIGEGQAENLAEEIANRKTEILEVVDLLASTIPEDESL